ncbi:MAG: thymidine phosphorylase [Clostridia bacterium]|nr:thymidine phosphorylase [Clostridia bacterium]
MTVYDIIRKKRDGFALSGEEISAFIEGFTRGEIPDYQASALLMAIYFNGMTDKETAAFTKAMAYSGETLDLSEFSDLTVDKHSTGGVGDKTTLIVAPIVSSLGCKVAKMSGRGLGFTGGTVDKLSSIPGYKVDMDIPEFLSIVERVGVSVVGQSKLLTPADKALYALRDVTATVDSIPLIASSIMSKKIATGSKSIVLDVKVGSGAFMKDIAQAEKLGEAMVDIGTAHEINTAAVLTDMNQPLGYAVGNNLEVIEAVKLLRGEKIPGLYEECIALAANMVMLVKKCAYGDAEIAVKESLSSGKAYTKFKEWISAQGGDISYIENTDKFPQAKYRVDVLSEESGYICRMDTENIGNCAGLLGAGREKVDDCIDSTAGVIICKKYGDHVSAGERLCTLYTNDDRRIDEIIAKYRAAIVFSDFAPEKLPTVYRTLHNQEEI